MKTSMKTVAALALGLAGLRSSGTLQAQEKPKMPPRMAGSVMVDEHTKAPLQFIVSARLKASQEKVFAHVSNDDSWVMWFDAVTGLTRKGSMRTYDQVEEKGGKLSDKILKSDVKSGTFAYSVMPGNPVGLKDHLGVIHVRPDEAMPKSSSVMTWYMYFDHAEAEMMNEGFSGKIGAVMMKLTEKFGGEYQGSASGVSAAKVTAVRVIEAPVSKVWDILAVKYGEVDKWSSMVSHTEIKEASGGGVVGSVRTCSVPGQPGFVEKILKFDESKKVFSYQVVEGLPPFVEKGVATWMLEDLGSGKTRATVEAVMDVKTGTPGAAVGMAKNSFFMVMGMAAEELSYFVQMGKPHPRVSMSEKK